LSVLRNRFFEGITWNENFGVQEWIETAFGAPFHDFAGSIVVHSMGGWIALAAVVLLGRDSHAMEKMAR
jgi:Amt family ammonium transporter